MAKFSEIRKDRGNIVQVGQTYVNLRPTAIVEILNAAEDENIPKATTEELLKSAVAAPNEILEIGGDTSVGIAPTDVVFHDGIYYSNLKQIQVRKSRVIPWRDEDEKSEDYVSKGDFISRRS